MGDWKHDFLSVGRKTAVADRDSAMRAWQVCYHSTIVGSTVCVMVYDFMLEAIERAQMPERSETR